MEQLLFLYVTSLSYLFSNTVGESVNALLIQPPAFPDLKLFIDDDALLGALLSEYTQPDNCLVDPALLGPISTLTSPSSFSSPGITSLPTNDCSALWSTAVPPGVTAKSSLSTSQVATSPGKFNASSSISHLPVSDDPHSVSVTTVNFPKNSISAAGGGGGEATDGDDVSITPLTDVATIPVGRSEQGSSDSRNVIIIVVCCVVGGLLVLIVSTVILVKCLPRIKQHYAVSKKKSVVVQRQETQVSTISGQLDESPSFNDQASPGKSNSNNNKHRKGQGNGRHVNGNVAYARQESTDTQHTIVSISSPDDASSTSSAAQQRTPPTQSPVRRVRPMSTNWENSSGGSPTAAADNSPLFNFMSEKSKPAAVKNDKEKHGDIGQHPNGELMLFDMVSSKNSDAVLTIDEEKIKIKPKRQLQQSTVVALENLDNKTAKALVLHESPGSSAKSLDSTDTNNTLVTTESLEAPVTETLPKHFPKPFPTQTASNNVEQTNNGEFQSFAYALSTSATDKNVDMQGSKSLQSTPLSIKRSISETPPTDKRLANEQTKRTNGGNGRFRPYSGGKNRARMRSDIGGKKLDRVEIIAGGRMPVVSPHPAGVVRQSSLHAIPVVRDDAINLSASSVANQGVVTTLPRKHTHAELVASDQVRRVKRPRSISSSVGLSEELMRQHVTSGFLPVSALGNGKYDSSLQQSELVHRGQQSFYATNSTTSPIRGQSNPSAPASLDSSFSSAPPTPNGTLGKVVTESNTPQRRLERHQQPAPRILRSQSVQQSPGVIILPYTSTPLNSTPNDSDVSSFAILSTPPHTPRNGQPDTPWTQVNYTTPTSAEHYYRRHGYNRSMSSAADVSLSKGILNNHTSPSIMNGNNVASVIAGRPPPGANRGSSVQRRLFADSEESIVNTSVDGNLIPSVNRRKSTTNENAKRRLSSTSNLGVQEVNVDEPMFDSYECLYTNDVSMSPNCVSAKTFNDILAKLESAASFTTNNQHHQTSAEVSLKGWSTFPRGTHTDATAEQQPVSNRRPSLDNHVATVDPVYF